MCITALDDFYKSEPKWTWVEFPLPRCAKTIRYFALAVSPHRINFVEKAIPYNQGWLKIWIWQLWQKFVTFIPLWILVNDTNIICLPSKDMQFCKIKRLWLKNWACLAHLKFKIQRSAEGSIFEPHPPKFGKIYIL